MSLHLVRHPRTYSTRECLTRAALRALLAATLLASVAPVLSALAPAPQASAPAPVVMRVQPAAPAVDLP